ncbi:MULTISPECIES: transcriptional regulator [Pseudomonas]|uniref:transcriptional regulator n=1 Tax=Pseudomonas TaxID=286 RepID=UPI000803418E|nr:MULTISPECIES: transcriptional regulator [Pseudomonas]UWI63333.1 transcriptional regulator [Pseudomonas sp. BW7P1]
MTTYNWDLIERLLHEVQNGAGHSFAPRTFAEDYAADKAAAGEPIENLDHLKTLACDYEKLLLDRGYITPREEDGSTGNNFSLTLRGSSLLSLIDSSIPGNDHPRQVLDEQEDALDEATFDTVASKAQIA